MTALWRWHGCLGLCVLLHTLSVAAGNDHLKLNRELLQQHAAMDRGIFGDRDAQRLERKLRSVQENDVLRTRILILLARYHHQAAGQPVKALRWLTPEVLGEKRAEGWLDALDDAETARTSAHKDAVRQAYFNRKPEPAEPTGLALDFPFDEVIVTASNSLCVLELARTMVALHEVQPALELIDRVGAKFEDDCRVEAYETFGDLSMKLSMVPKAVTAYRHSLDLLKSLKPSEGFDSWQQMIMQRLRKKMAAARRRLDIERYGPGFVLYRQAERKRLENHQFGQALLLYERLIREFPNTVWEQAARCYRMKCRLELGKAKHRPESLHKAINDLRQGLEALADDIRKAKRHRVPDQGIRALETRQKQLTAQLETLRDLPVGRKSLTLATEEARRRLKANRWGLYNGEMLCSLGDFYLEYRYDVEKAVPYYRESRSWCEAVPAVDETTARFAVPGKAVKVSAPPPGMRTHDVWGNVWWAKVSPGMVVNRRTSTWYVDRLRMMTQLKQALCLFILGESDEAAKLVDIILEVDEVERGFHETGWPSNYSRLRAGFKSGYLSATTEELNHFKGDLRTAILVGDFYYEIEQKDMARKQYRRIDRLYGSKLKLIPRAYLDMMLGQTTPPGHMKLRIKYLQKFENIPAYEKSPSWPRAMFSLAVYYQNEKETRPRTFACFRRVYEAMPDTDIGREAYFHWGSFEYTLGDEDTGRRILEDCIKRFEGSWLAKGARNVFKDPGQRNWKHWDEEDDQ